MPLSVLFAFCVIILWPLAKLLGAAVSRRYWKKLRSIELSLLSDPRYRSHEDREIVEAEIASARSQPLYLLLPVVVFFGGIAFAIAEALGQSDLQSDVNEIRRKTSQQMVALHGDRPIVADERFSELHDITFVLAALNYPVCSGATAISLIVVAPIILVAGGLRASVAKVASRVLRSSANAALVFGRGMGTPRAA